jgi:hypothetical protein
MRWRTVLWSVAGPAAFGSAAAAGSRMFPGYSRRDEPISALAAQGSPAAGVMVPGFLALAIASVALADELRGSPAAPAPVPAMLAIAGLTTAGAGLARCSDPSCPTRGLPNEADVQPVDDAHLVTSAITFGLWIAIPLVAAARARGAGAGYRSWSRRLGLATLAGLVGGGMLARRPDSFGSGVAQRATLTAAFSWYVLAAVHTP